MKIIIIACVLFLVSCKPETKQEAPKTNLNYLGVISNIYKTDSQKVKEIYAERNRQQMEEAEK
jgi:hypothetical protein